MFLIRAGHPLLAQVQRIAEDHQTSVMTVDGPALSRLERTKLDGSVERLVLLGRVDERAAWLRSLLFVPEGRRPRSFALLGDDATSLQLHEALRAEMHSVRFLVVDHNLSTTSELALSLAWGAAVALLEGEKSLRTEGGLWNKVKGSVSSARDLADAWTTTSTWRLGEGEEVLRAGFMAMSSEDVPGPLERFMHTEDGRLSAVSSQLSPNAWQGLEVTDTPVLLRGDGAWMLNGHRRRARGVDQLFLRALAPVAVALIGSQR